MRAIMPGVLRTVTATRYVTPFREGGSLPGLFEADDDGLYVVKFRGAGQGRGALAAEVVAGELARALGLPVPELVLVEIDPALAAAEPDPEIQDLVVASAGLNLGLDFLPGALAYASAHPPAASLAADVLWFDALVTNVDRTPRNPNLLRWHDDLWLIDHGAALYAFHSDDPLSRAATPFGAIRDHVLAPAAGSAREVRDADARLASVAADALEAVTGLLPPDWGDGALYREFLARRLSPVAREAWLAEADRAVG